MKYYSPFDGVVEFGTRFPNGSLDVYIVAADDFNRRLHLVLFEKALLVQDGDYVCSGEQLTTYP